MSNAAFPLSEEHKESTEAQRHCLAHLMRECSITLTALGDELERNKGADSPQAVGEKLEVVFNRLASAIGYLRCGSWCAIEPGLCTEYKRSAGCGESTVAARTISINKGISWG